MDATRLQFHGSIPEIAEAWLDLEKQCAHPSIQNNYMVLNAWYACYLAGRQPAFLSLWRGTECLGIYPFTMERKYGARVYNTLYHESFSISKPIVRDGQEEVFFTELVRHLEGHKHTWDVIKFSSIYCFDAEDALLTTALAANDRKVFRVHEPTFVMDLEGSYENYCQTHLSKKTRENLRRLERKAARTNSAIVSYTNYEALPHMRRFYEMENMGWKKEAGTALVNVNDNLVYCEALIHNSCLTGKYLLTFFELDGKKIAGQLGYIEDGVYNGLRTAYDRDYAQLGPSVLLITGTVRLLCETYPEVKRLHCYPGSYGYKQKYAHDRCACNTYVLFGDTLKGKLLSLAYSRKMSQKTAPDVPSEP